ncbi:MAG TPA: Gfo/Idh/MocA family oxidoreductase [Acidimicrobiales bacterium]|nr:Gfo/Idh/MocA family oxidoreductase [Acidimicrobiales bacterium]
MSAPDRPDTGGAVGGGGGGGALGAVVVGTGFGCYSHVRALHHAGVEVRALVGRDPAKTAERARLFEVPRACATLAEALGAVDVDAVTIATPPHTHAPLALEAIAAGKHVLCEKPFARNTAEGRAVLAAAQQEGIVHLLGTEFRYDAGQALLADAVRAGLVGAPRIATWLMHVPMLADPGAQLPEWWADADAGGGWLGAHGSQLIDQIRVTLGEFEGVSASVIHVVERPMTADDGFVIHFRMRTGCVGVLQSTASDRGIIVETRVTGSTGSAWIEGVGDTVRVADASGVRRLPVPDDLRGDPAPPLPDGAVTTTYEQMITFGVEYGPYTRLAAAFRDRILGRPAAGPQPATFADGVAQMAVLDAVRHSARAGGAWTEVAPV